jgi:hypothetical protein
MDLKIQAFYIYNDFLLENASGKLVTGGFPLSVNIIHCSQWQA